MSFVKPIVFGFIVAAAAGQCFADVQTVAAKDTGEAAPLISEKYLMKKPADAEKDDRSVIDDSATKEVQLKADETREPTEANVAVVDVAETQSTEVNKAVVDDVATARQEASPGKEGDAGEGAKPVDLDLSSVDPNASGRVNVVRDRLNWSHATTDMSDRVEYLKQLKEALELRNEIKALGRGEGLADVEKMTAASGDFGSGYTADAGGYPTGFSPDIPPSPQHEFSPREQLGLEAVTVQPLPRAPGLHVVEVYGDYVVLREGDKDIKLRVGSVYKGKQITITKEGVVMVGGKSI